jgi:hypothetical protein
MLLGNEPMALEDATMPARAWHDDESLQRVHEQPEQRSRQGRSCKTGDKPEARRSYGTVHLTMSQQRQNHAQHNKV